MNAFTALIRRVRELWTALMRRLSGPPRAPAALPEPAVTSEEPSPRVAAVSAEPAAVSRIEATESSTSMSLPVSASIVVAASTSMSGSSAATTVSPPRPAFVANAKASVSVRQFFARVAAGAPGGLSFDFAAWESAKVERFFMAMAAPERTQRRGPALAEEVGLGHAFEGFQWD
jgi:hypothetical protein